MRECCFSAVCPQWQQTTGAEQGPELGHPKPKTGNSSLYIQCVKNLRTSENQAQSQVLWQPSRRLLSLWHLAWSSAPNSLWSTPFWLFIKSIFSSFCIHSIGQFQIPFFLPHLTAACSNYRALLLSGSLLPLDPITSDNLPFHCKALSKDGKFIFSFPPGNIKDRDSNLFWLSQTNPSQSVCGAFPALLLGFHLLHLVLSKRAKWCFTCDASSVTLQTTSTKWQTGTTPVLLYRAAFATP